MTEQNTIKREWPINDVRQDFLNFIENYGKIQHGEFFKIRERGRGLLNLPPCYDYSVFLDYRTVAHIVFEFESTLDGLKVMATMSSNPAAYPFTEETLQYFADMDRAIRKKYPKEIKKKRIIDLATVPPFNELTDREREVADLLADGLTNKEIGKQIMISESTANAHSDHIAAKLKIKGRRARALSELREKTG